MQVDKSQGQGQRESSFFSSAFQWKRRQRARCDVEDPEVIEENENNLGIAEKHSQHSAVHADKSPAKADLALNRKSSERYRRKRSDALLNIIAGGAAGALSKTCTAPLSRLTILLQVRGGQMSDVFNAIVTKDGLRALWRGNLTSCIHRIPYSSINFLTFEKMKKYLTEGKVRNADIPFHIRMMAGGTAGAVALMSCYPLDLVRTRLSSQIGHDGHYNGIIHALRTIIKQEGWKSLYKGSPATLLQVVPTMAINYTTYETTKYWLKGMDHPLGSQMSTTLVAATTSGFVSGSIMFPFDLVRRNMQMQGAYNYRTYDSIFHCAQTIVRAEGVAGLYRGLVPELLRVTPTVCLLYGSYEWMKDFFARYI
eukprot:g4175.t1